MPDWRDDARAQLQDLHAMLTSPSLTSEVPLYVIERLVENTERLICSTLHPKNVRDLAVGTLKAASDASFADDDDPVIKRLLVILETLPAEE